METVSVIVPVYNAGEALQRCADSILAQTYEALEVLFVNDGSTDDSPEVLRALEKRDPRVRVFSQKNAGVAAARNLALDNATGKYIRFVDSDDIAPRDSTRLMACAMEDERCDIVIARYIERAGEARHTRGYFDKGMRLTQHELLDILSRHPNSFYYGALWNKLYRRALIEQGGIRFLSSITWGEDFAFNMRYMGHTASAAIIPETVYEYVRSMKGLALRAAVACAAHPIYSINVKRLLHGYYKQLYIDAGLYEEYKSVLNQYLFKMTISN